MTDPTSLSWKEAIKAQLKDGPVPIRSILGVGGPEYLGRSLAVLELQREGVIELWGDGREAYYRLALGCPVTGSGTPNASKSPHRPKASGAHNERP